MSFKLKTEGLGKGYSNLRIFLEFTSHTSSNPLRETWKLPDQGYRRHSLQVKDYNKEF